MGIVIEGITSKLKDNVTARIVDFDETKINDTPYFKKQLETEIKKGLKALGYYNPQFGYSTSKDKSKLIVKIDKGLPVLITSTDINILGEASKDADFIKLLKNMTPKVGDVLNHGAYDDFKNALKNLAINKGYFDAVMTKNQLIVYESTQKATWKIDFDTGKRYKYGKITFKSSNISDEVLNNTLPFKESDYYTADDITQLNRHLSATNWFSSVSIVPDFNSAKDSLPIEVITKPKKNSVEIGLGYSSDNALRASANYISPFVNQYGHNFQAKLSLNKNENSVALNYKLPVVKSPLEQYYAFSFSQTDRNINDTSSESFLIKSARHWDNLKSWQISASINLLYESFKQDKDAKKTFILYPSIVMSKITADNNVNTLNGYSQHYSVDLASNKMLSDINLMKIQTQNTIITTLKDKHRLVARGDLGLILTNNFEKLPPSFRFFAGGDRSIRGYEYQTVAPKNESGKLMGGSKLITGSFEYQYQIYPAWWSAFFIDGGSAFNKFKEANLYVGAGIGARWDSPIGKIKIDIATPVNQKKNSILFYLGLGTEL